MTALDSIFRVANFGAVIAWIVLCLAVVFGWRRAIDRFCGLVVPVPLAAAYVILLVTHWGGGDFTTLSGVMTLFRQPAAVVAGWLHYLAFDLLIGTVIARQALEERIPRVLMLPALVLTFFFGPAGWLLYQAIRFARRAPASSPAAIKPRVSAR